MLFIVSFRWFYNLSLRRVVTEKKVKNGKAKLYFLSNQLVTGFV